MKIQRIVLVATIGLALAATPAFGAWKTSRPGERHLPALTMRLAERVIQRDVLRLDRPQTAKITSCWRLKLTAIRCWVREINVPGIIIVSGGARVYENELDWKWTANLRRGHIGVQAF